MKAKKLAPQLQYEIIMGATEGRNRRRAHLRKRKASERDEEEDDGVNLQATQRKKQTGLANAFNAAPKGDGPSATFQYDSSGTVQQNTDMGATKMLELCLQNSSCRISFLQ